MFVCFVCHIKSENAKRKHYMHGEMRKLQQTRCNDTMDHTRATMEKVPCQQQIAPVLRHRRWLPHQADGTRGGSTAGSACQGRRRTLAWCFVAGRRKEETSAAVHGHAQEVGVVPPNPVHVFGPETPDWAPSDTPVSPKVKNLRILRRLSGKTKRRSIPGKICLLGLLLFVVFILTAPRGTRFACLVKIDEQELDLHSKHLPVCIPYPNT